MREQGVKSADRVLDLLELLTSAPDGLSLSHVVSRLTWPKSSTHALLRTMERRGYLSRNDASRTFHIGIRLWEAGQAYRLHADLALHALPAMQRVVDDVGETVQLAVRDGRDNVYVAKVESQQPMQLVSRIGSRIPSHGTGLGKVLLADLTDRELDALYLDVTLQRFTPNTITDLARLKEVVHEVRRVGHAVDEEEFALGLRCIAVPIVGIQQRTMAALSCSIPSARLDAAKAQHTLTVLKHAAAEISRRMGADVDRQPA